MASILWAGQYDCSICRQKNLIAVKFSNKMIQNHKNNGKLLKCKECVANIAQDERDKAIDNNNNKLNTDNNTNSTVCSACSKDLPIASFNNNQLKKGIYQSILKYY
jgi:hypothetical protein